MQVNGSAAAQHSYLMNGLLKDELGFQGFVMSDWLAQISGVQSALAGLDMSMPGDRNEIPLLGNSYWMYDYSRAVLNGSVPIDRLNDAVTRILATYFQMGQDQNYPRPNFDANTQDAEGPLYPGALFSPTGVVNEFVDVQGNHAEVAREVARDAITLLKNQNNVLPLARNASLKIFGTDAEKNPDGINSCADQGCNKGTLGMVSTQYSTLIKRSADARNRRAGVVDLHDTHTWIRPSMASNLEGRTTNSSTLTRFLPAQTRVRTILPLSS
jgi:beta-glucosidase